MKRKDFLGICSICLLALNGCSGPETKGGYMGTGAAAGAATGALIGQLAGGNTQSTVTGAVIGGLGGALVGDLAHDNQEKKAARNQRRGYEDDPIRQGEQELAEERLQLRKADVRRQRMAVENDQKRLGNENRRLDIEEAKLEERRRKQRSQLEQMDYAGEAYSDEQTAPHYKQHSPRRYDDQERRRRAYEQMNR